MHLLKKTGPVGKQQKSLVGLVCWVNLSGFKTATAVRNKCKFVQIKCQNLLKNKILLISAKHIVPFFVQA